MNKKSHLKNRENIIFFAYQGQLKEESDNNVDSIRKAIEEYNKYQGHYLAKSWEEYRTTTAISKDVLNAIDQCEVLVADLTYFNHNVLFEMGYAIAKDKKILILLNKQNKLENNLGTSEKVYSSFALRDIRYSHFTNYKHIQEALQKNLFEGDLLNRLINVKNIAPKSNDIFYVLSKETNQASLDLTSMIQAFKDEKKLKLISDDSTEVKFQTLKWYLQNLLQAKVVIVHFIGDKTENSFMVNAQNSLFAGLACGRGCDVLLAAPAKYKAPLDYNDILIQYTSSEELGVDAIDWLGDKFQHVVVEKKAERIEPEHEVSLMKLGIGCAIAEGEEQELLSYFVYTGSYQAALNYDKTILIGRKGSGKTAIYIKLLNELSSDYKNYVVKLRPESEELLEDAHLAQLYIPSRQSFFSAVWKLVILSKLANTINERLKIKVEGVEYSDAEKEIINFVEREKGIIQLNFFGIVRMISIKVRSSGKIDNPDIMETLFEEYLSPLAKSLEKYFSSIKEKYYRVIILADNLDKTWDTKNDLSVQREMIFSLFEIENKIKNELIHEPASKIEIKQIVFLREDIFDHIRKNAIEPDKLTAMCHFINWEDYPALLRDLIENRFAYILSLRDKIEIEQKAWKEFFDFKEKEHPYELILEIITKRPRDLIYFVAKLFESAINNEHEKVNKIDLKYAIINYTEFLNNNLIAETRAEFPEIADILAKLQEYHGQKIEYGQFTKILSEFKYDQPRQQVLIETLFDKGYMLGYDDKTEQPFSEIKTLHKKLKEKNFFVFPNKVYLIAHAKYYLIKNKSFSPF
ncbi:MAG TPA: hypothetical protein DCE80_06345 [Ignavibacteriales bacterium]|nr:hypothetical protein [Ignavibacteriales bacterium]